MSARRFKMPPAKVARIIQALSLGHLTQSEIAAEYCVSVRTVERIKRDHLDRVGSAHNPDSQEAKAQSTAGPSGHA